MIDGVSLDQLRLFVASADEGSFTAAARKIRRAQSVVSASVSGLEGRLDVVLFDRFTRYPALTPAGVALLADARSVIAGVDAMKARAKGLSSGLEPELAVAVDVLFPMAAITNAAEAFRIRFPGTPVRLLVEALGAAYQLVLDGSASVAIAAALPSVPIPLRTERLSGVALTMVAARGHPLATIEGTIPKAELAKHVQLVLTDRSALSAGMEFSVMSPSVWRLTDLFAKHAFLIDGLGWGGMPVHAVARDIAEGRLVELQIEDLPSGAIVVPMAVAYPTASPPGPAGRWFIERLKASAEAGAGPPAP